VAVAAEGTPFMQDGAQGNAMTEIALALSMGFFSILVLTMVSMGAGMESGASSATELLTPAPSTSAGDRSERLGATDTIVIYHRGRYYGDGLVPLDPASVGTAGRVVLAFDPTVDMAEVMAASRAFAAEDLVIATLNERWQRALAGLAEGG
ncbi:MAG: hypothetical protein ACE5Q3_18510, partial [Alphaproteobacteria bacterium]